MSDDPLLWRARRAVKAARDLTAENGDPRQVQMAATDLQAIVSALNGRARELDGELQAVTHRLHAATAYRRLSKLGRASPGK